MENTVNPAPTAPVGQLKTNKGLLKTILLSIITFGIYGCGHVLGVQRHQRRRLPL